MASPKNLMAAAIALAWLGVGSAAQAADPLVREDSLPGKFSANAALTSEYFFRGISQTDDRPALQGGFDYEAGLTKGLDAYLGVWGSNVNFNDSDEANIELDYYGGLRGTVGKIGWDVGGIYYSYPGADGSLNYDFIELAASLNYDFGFASATAGLNYSPDYFGASGSALYPSLGVEVPLGKLFTLAANVGYQTIDDNAAFGTPDYLDYSVGVSANIVGFDVGLTWTDTDMTDAECDDACGMVALSVSRSF